ncbi:MAG TPA: hypothetical protein VN606_14160, partial [Thermoleophilaceae bacterium]|nr:hypothetical protein [Thermoleophilaceae bacterium]
VTFTDSGGVQTSLWGNVDREKATPDEFMVEHFAQRRKSIVDDCVKLKSDVDHFNATPGRMTQLPLILEFSDDVAEREAMRGSGGDEPRPQAN